MLRYLSSLFIGLAVLSAACSPTYNWREVRLERGGLKVLLPCKPDQGNRQMKLADKTVDIQMAGCEAGDALFAVSHADLGDEQALPAALEQWKAAMLGNMRAKPDTRVGAYVVKDASARIVPVRLTAIGQRADDSAVTAQGLWFVRGTHLYHAVVYAGKANAEVAETFFSSMELQ